VLTPPDLPQALCEKVKDMAWVRLDDKFPEHPKIEGLDDSAFALHVRALCYANRNLTDGFVPTAAASRMGGAHYKRSAQRLMAAGLWVSARDGYTIHDYLEFQPARSSVVESRKAAAGRMRALRSGNVPANIERSSGEVHEPRTQPRTHVSKETGTTRNDAVIESAPFDFRGILKRMPG